MSSFSQKQTDADSLDEDKSDAEDSTPAELQDLVGGGDDEHSSTARRHGDDTNGGEEFELDPSREAADSREIEDIIQEVEEKLAIDETEERLAKHAVTKVREAQFILMTEHSLISPSTPSLRS